MRHVSISKMFLNFFENNEIYPVFLLSLILYDTFLDSSFFERNRRILEMNPPNIDENSSDRCAQRRWVVVPAKTSTIKLVRVRDISNLVYNAYLFQR